MKHALLASCFALVGAALAAGQATQESPKAAQVEHGRYLVAITGCADCHSPKRMGAEGPEPIPDRYLAGHPEDTKVPPPPPLPEGLWNATNTWDLTAWSGPWGISYSINLTPDENTGLGIWTEEMFVQSLRTGRHMGRSRPILPPMPWQTLRNLTNEDLKAMYAYLRTIPPIHNSVPEPVPPAAPPPKG